MKKNIEISTVSVSIKTIVLDGKRFTKSVFNQLPESYLYKKNNTGGWNIAGKIIGFVKIPDDPWRWVLFENDGVLFKCLGKKHRDEPNYNSSKYHPHKSYIFEGIDKNSSEENKEKDIFVFYQIRDMPEKDQLFISI